MLCVSTANAKFPAKLMLQIIARCTTSSDKPAIENMIWESVNNCKECLAQAAKFACLLLHAYQKSLIISERCLIQS
jgi:hypothetical protein